MKKTIGIIKPLNKPEYYDAVFSELNNIESAELKEIDWKDFNISDEDVVVFPEPSAIPFGAGRTLDKYLKNGGNLVSLGGPALTSVLHGTGDGWLPREELTAEQGKYEGRPIVWDFEKPEDAEGWYRVSHKTDNYHKISVGDYGSPDSKGALKIEIKDYAGWDMIGKGVNLSADYDNIGMYVRGGEGTGSMTVEMIEKDVPFGLEVLV